METTTIRKIGNSKGIILPKSIISKYEFWDVVMIIDNEDGITIKPIERKSLFLEKLDKARANKKEIYKTMEQQAGKQNVIAYYSKQVEELGDIDLNILEE